MNEEIVERLKAHIGHDIVIVTYGGDCVSLECDDCSEVIIDEEVLLSGEDEDDDEDVIILTAEGVQALNDLEDEGVD